MLASSYLPGGIHQLRQDSHWTKSASCQHSGLPVADGILPRAPRVHAFTFKVGMCIIIVAVGTYQ